MANKLFAPSTGDDQTGRDRSRGTGESGGHRSRRESLLWEVGELVLQTLVREYFASRNEQRATSSDRSRRVGERSASESSGGDGGRNTMRWVFGGLALLAVGYLLRNRYGPVRETVGGRLSQTSQRAAERTEEMSQRASERVREGGETVADRAEEMSERAAERTESRGEEVSDQLEEGGEKASETVDTS